MDKILTIIFLAGKLLTVSLPQSISAPNGEGLAQIQYSQTILVYAHSNLSGTLFYDLYKGDKVVAIYNDGQSYIYTVSDIGAYAAKSTKSMVGNFDLRVNDEWIPFTDVINIYTIPDSITLLTCYASDNGMGIVTGRLFVQLLLEENINDHHLQCINAGTAEAAQCRQ